MQRVPFGILRQAIYPSGVRLPQRRLLELDSTVHTLVRSPMPEDKKLVLVDNVVPVEGNIPHEAYQLFVGSLNRSYGICRCRGCLRNVNIEERKGHMLACKQVVLATAKLLRRDHRCVSCNMRTSTEKWGFPLCRRNACEQVWMFANAKPYLDARTLVLRESPQLKEAVS